MSERYQKTLLYLKNNSKMMKAILDGESEKFNAAVIEYVEKKNVSDTNKITKYRENLFHKAVIGYLEKDFYAWCKFFLNEHFGQSFCDLHYEIQDALFSGNKYLAFACPRGTGKSTIVSIAYILYNILNKKENNIIVISINQKTANLLISNVKSELMNNERILEFYGNQRSKDNWSEESFIWDDSIIVQAFGLGVSMRAAKWKQHRPTLCVLDDIESRDIFSYMDNATSEALNRYKDYIFREVIPALNPQTGRLRYVGTIFHPQALLPYMMKSKLFFSVKRSMIESVDGEDVSIWPERFPMIELNKLRDALVEQGQADVWWSEYMNEPISEDTRDFVSPQKYSDEDMAKIKKNLIYFMGFDLAASKGSKDKTAAVVIGRDSANSNKFYVMQYVNDRLDITESISAIVDMAEYWKVIIANSNKDLIATSNERNFHEYALSKSYSFPLKLNQDHQQSSSVKFGNSKSSKMSKRQRLSFLAPLLKAGRILVHESHGDLISQLETYPASVNDDLLDALLEAIKRSYPSDKNPDEQDADAMAQRLDYLVKKLRGEGRQQSPTENESGESYGRWDD